VRGLMGEGALKADEDPEERLSFICAARGAAASCLST
jgi:hypothetical protein